MDYLINGSFENATIAVFTNNSSIPLGQLAWIIPIIGILGAIWLYSENVVLTGFMAGIMGLAFTATLPEAYQTWVGMLFLGGLTAGIWLLYKTKTT